VEIRGGGATEEVVEEEEDDDGAVRAEKDAALMEAKEKKPEIASLSAIDGDRM